MEAAAQLELFGAGRWISLQHFFFLAWTLAALRVSKLEHADQYTMTFGTISSCLLFCSQSRGEEPSFFALALAPCRTGLF